MNAEEKLFVYENLPKIDFWNVLDERQKQSLYSATSSAYFGKGDVVHSGSAKCTGVIFVVRGAIRVYMITEDGREVTLYVLNSDDYCVLSASCVIKSITFDVFVDAAENTRALIINPSVFSAVTEENVRAENLVLKTAVKRFSSVMWTFQQILYMRLDKKVASYLISAAKKGIVRITHEQIAAATASSREAVTRMLKKFADDEIIKSGRGEIVIVDAIALEKIAK